MRNPVRRPDGNSGRGRKVRVLHVITRFIIGGAQENTLATLKYQSENPSYLVDVCTGPPLGPEGSMMEELCALAGVNVLMVPEMRREINPLLDAKAFLKVFGIIKKGKYDIVHTHSSKAGVLGRLAAGLAGAKVIIHTIHGLPFHPYQNAALNYFYVYLEYVCALLTRRIITVSEAMKRKAVRAGVAGEGKFVTIYSGMNLEDFLNIKEKSEKKMRELGLGRGDTVVGKIARLFPLKGHEYLLEAAEELSRRHENIRFLIIGDGILRKELESRVKRLGLAEKFIFTGLVKRREIPGYISVIDILVHVSLREGLARVLPQALAAGKPAVSFDIDGAREVVVSGATGIVIKPGDLNGLKDAVTRLALNPREAERMGEAGREKVRQMFCEKNMVERINSVYDMELQAAEGKG